MNTAPTRAERIVAFLREAKRRKVYVTAVGYVAVALVMEEVGGVVFTASNLADGPAPQIFSILLLLGFPVVLVLAWLFDITTSGVKRTEPFVVTPRRAPDAALASAPLPRMPERSRPKATSSPDTPAAPVDPLRVKRATLGHMRHELRTPINGILGYAEMLLEDEPPADLAADLQRITAAGKKLLALIDEILNPDRLVNGAAERSLESFGAQVAADLRTPTNSVIGYAELLIENARESGNEHVVPDLERILGSARRLLELSGDIMRVATGAEPGLATDVALNTSSRLTESVLAKIRPASQSAAAEGEGTVLVVDDNPLNRDLLSRQLARRGYIVETAADGREALDKLAAREFDVVLLDVIMPQMDGVETLQRIRADARLEDLPVLMLSSIDEVDSAIRCIELGAEEYLPKPFQPTLLEARIAANVALRRMRARDRVYDAQLAATRQTLARLAHAVFPARVATRVLQGERAIEESFAEATVVACMLPRELRGASGGRELLERVRAITAAAETAVAEHGIDARVCRSFGVLLLSPAFAPGEDHAGRALAAAAALQRRAEATGLPVCIAVHSGPVLAGVIGQEGLRYEAWGDGAETAEALTHHGVPGTVLVSPTAYALLRDRFAFDTRGVAEIAGRGQMKLYRLTGELSATVSA